MKLAGVGRNNVLVIKSNIKKKLESKNYYVQNNAVPMQEVVKYLNIDIPYLEARANQISAGIVIIDQLLPLLIHF